MEAPNGRRERNYAADEDLQRGVVDIARRAKAGREHEQDLAQHAIAWVWFMVVSTVGG